MTHPFRAVVLFISTLVGACGGSTGGGDAPTIDHFDATPASVCAGAAATLSWAFSGGNGVITPGDLALDSETGSKALTPAATTTYVLTVTSSNGLSTAEATVTVVARPVVIITAPASIATGVTTFTASVAAVAGATYAWRVTSGNGTVSQGGDTREATVTVTGTGTLDLEATVTATGAGCPGVATASVALPGAPAISSFSASAASVCEGDSLDLSYAFTNGAGTIMPGPVVLADQAGRVSVTPDASGTYVLTVTGTGPAATAEAAVTVLPNPDATITAPASATVGVSGLTASVPDLAGATYAWTVTGGTVTAGDGTRAITFDVGTPGSVVVSVTVTDAASGCAATRETTVTVVAPPPAITTFTATPTTLCPGESTRLDYAFVNGVGSITPGPIALVDLAGHVSTPVSATTTYTLTVHGTAPDATAQVTITALAAPDATITAPVQALVGATGLTASALAGASYYSWSITTGNGAITSGNGTSTITFDATGATAGTLTLRVSALDDSTGCSTVRTFDVSIIEPPPVINSFSAQSSSACTGGTVRLTYDFAHGTGVITPGPVNLADTSGYVDVPLNADTTFTLTVSGNGAPATAQTPVTAVAAPTASLDVAAQTIAGVPTQATGSPGTGVSYAWAVTSGNGRITAGQDTAAATFVASAKGTLTLSLAVTDQATGCQGTATADVAVNHGCGTPMLISTDWTQNPAVPFLTPSSNLVPALAVNSSSEVWTRFEVQQNVGYVASDLAYNRVNLDTGVVLGGVAGATTPFLNTQSVGTIRVQDSKVAVDEAGNAVFVWVQYDGSTYVPYVRGYDAASKTMYAAQKLTSTARVWNAGVQLSLAMHATSGKAIIAWVQTPSWPNSVPHTIEYTVANDSLSNEVAFRTSPTDNLSPERTRLHLETNSTLDGFAVWFEADGSNVPSMYALRFQAGAPDRVAGVPDIQTLVVGSSTSSTDILNSNSPWTATQAQFQRMVAVSENGNAAVLWGVNNSIPTATAATYVRRFTGGSWQARETVAAEKFGFADWAIDDNGDMVALLESMTWQYFTTSPIGTAWPPPSQLVNNPNTGTASFVRINHATGDGFVIYPNSAHLYGRFYDRATRSLSAGVQLDTTPNEYYTYNGNVVLDATGRAVVSYNQGHITGGTTSKNAYQWVTTCQ